ncbi:tRNA modification GTPase GTPBP3, mitochondrial isoform X2 [Palaemon carinicauda]|uniref:tRNA modification GTPase GTPBP3, mitochondrial isoform X2 n=1 Tax=Palaemon carinicauda TaxID=392227 RepID=UPI0035B5C67F
MFIYLLRGKLWHHLTKPIYRQKSIRRCLSTVYALSSGQGKCGVALIRVTGSRAREVISDMTVPSALPQPRVATLRRIIHPVTGDFTKRAFYNGKLDLTSVEGLGDLIHAETEEQRKQALLQMEGALGQLYSSWRQMLLHCRANIEAFIDFSEDENIEEGVVKDVEMRIRQVIEEMENHLADNRRGERLRSGLKLAILGRPNVGKSSFMNAIVQRPAAIVSPIPGTTRDVVESTLDLGGYPVIISDTAGLHQTDDIVESEGIKRAIAKSREADIAIIIIDAKEALQAIKQSLNWGEYVNSFLTEIGVCKEKSTFENDFIVLVNKIDLIECKQDRTLLKNTVGDSGLVLSVKTSEGLVDAVHKLKNVCASLCEIGTAENPTLTAARHRIHISACLESLKLILGNELNTSHRSKTPESATHSSQTYFEDLNDNLLHSEEMLIIAAHHLQKAATHLGYVTGHITTEDVLNHIFSAFCIGK